MTIRARSNFQHLLFFSSVSSWGSKHVASWSIQRVQFPWISRLVIVNGHGPPCHGLCPSG